MMILESDMQEFVRKLGLNLQVVHVPEPNNPRHAEIKGNTILIHGSSKAECWNSLIHEVVEYRLKPLLRIYREAINSLISLLEQVAYSQKEQAVENIMKDFEQWKELEQASAPTSQGEEQKGE